MSSFNQQNGGLLDPDAIQRAINALQVSVAALGSSVQVLAKSAAAVPCPADTTEDILATITVPAGAMGANGFIRITTVWTFTSSANTKTPRVRFGGGSGTQYLNASFATVAGLHHQILIANQNAANSQIGSPNNTTTFNSSTNAPTTSAVDTTAATTIVISGQKGLGSETLTLNSYLVELMYGA